MLFLLFVAVPLLDLWLLVQIGRAIGLWPTVGLVLLAGAVGALAARREGARVLRGWRAAIATGRAPDEGVLSGILVLLGAFLLVAPGLLTDLVGLALLLPPSRRLVAARVRRWLERQVTAGRVRVVTFGGPRGPGPHAGAPDEIDVTPRDPPSRAPDDPGAVRRLDER